MLAHALIDPLVVSTEQSEAWLLGQFLSDLLIEKASLRCEIDNRAALMHSFNGSKDWIRFHDHARTTTIGIIIDDMMLIGRGVTNIMQSNAEQIALLRSLQDALAEWSLEHGR